MENAFNFWVAEDRAEDIAAIETANKVIGFFKDYNDWQKELMDYIYNRDHAGCFLSARKES